MIRLTQEPIDPQEVLAAVQSVEAGAVVLFLGTVRQHTAGRETTHLVYECYPAMAERKLSELAAEARERWGVVELAIVHRLGRLELGDVAVAVAVSTPHRAAAFAAGEWLMDTIKQVVPIWKREHWTDGHEAWVHPGLDGSSLETLGGSTNAPC